MTEDTRTYELSYLVTPTTADTEIDAVVAGLKEVIEKAEGAVIAEAAPEFIDLAYTIEKIVASKKMKWDQGYFGWIKFTASPEAMEVLKKAYDANRALMRYMLIKTSAENLVTFKKPKSEARRSDASVDEILAEETNEEQSEEDVREVHETLPDLEAEALETAATETSPEVAE